MINGAHVLLYSQDPDADRAFFRDVLELRAVDAGHGWLIFALPPAEAALHPASEAPWGLKATIPLPSGGDVGLYRPTSSSAPTASRPPARRTSSRSATDPRLIWRLGG
jgi:catechol 2,3-dioxygenase-like lactoylglutathione lyase family enzyme